ncbi:MAG: ZIP family metal transporter [Planctomycetes bacterium]|nr:ZIP family metal transporter [Planctomycetota bacterium]
MHLTPMTLVLLRTTIAMAAALVGALAAVSVRQVTHERLCTMISLAAGALLGVTAFEIVPESWRLLGGSGRALGATGELAVAAAGGYLAFYLLGKFVAHICPACSATHSENFFSSVNLLMMISIGIHSVVDGLGIAAGSQGQGSKVGVFILLAVSYHKVPEGLALATLGRGSGYSRAKAFTVAGLVELTTQVGGFLGLLLLGRVGAASQGAILAAVAGSFLYLVLHALLGEMVKHEEASVVKYMLLGFGSLMLLAWGLEHLGLAG